MGASLLCFVTEPEDNCRRRILYDSGMCVMSCAHRHSDNMFKILLFDVSHAEIGSVNLISGRKVKSSFART